MITHLDHADTREEAWRIADDYAARIKHRHYPLRVGVRRMPGRRGGFEIYTRRTNERQTA